MANWLELRFDKWVGYRKGLLKRLGMRLKPNLIAAVLLALHDLRNQSVDTKQISTHIQNQGVCDFTPSLASISTALSRIGKKLNSDSVLKLEFLENKPGTKEQNVLLTLNRPDRIPIAVDYGELRDKNVWENEIIKELLSQNFPYLPAKALYLLSSTANDWIHFSRSLSRSKAKYESSFWQENKLDTWFHPENTKNAELNVVSLGTGEGLGEIELLKRIVADLPNCKINYLCLDSSRHLLRSHCDEIREELYASKNLKIAGIRSDVFEIQNAIKRADTLFQDKYGYDFLGQDAPLIVTCFGNVLGNFYQREFDLVRSIQECCSYKKLAIVFGVASAARTKEKYDEDDSFFEFPLHTLQKLVEMGLVKIGFQKEFDLKTARAQNRLTVDGPNEYSVSVRQSTESIKGRTHEFYYSLRGDIKGKADSRQVLAGTKILLMQIIKYDIESFSKCFSKLDFKVNHLMPQQFSGNRRYSLITLMKS